jgi:hypothetical protein
MIQGSLFSLKNSTHDALGMIEWRQTEAGFLVTQTFAGYILPLMVLYVWEMRDRWVFAKRYGLPVSGLTGLVVQEATPVLRWIALHLFVMLTLKLDF